MAREAGGEGNLWIFWVASDDKMLVGRHRVHANCVGRAFSKTPWQMSARQASTRVDRPDAGTDQLGNGSGDAPAASMLSQFDAQLVRLWEAVKLPVE